MHGMADAVNGTTVIRYQGEEYDFGKPFARLTVEEAIFVISSYSIHYTKLYDRIKRSSRKR